MFTAIQNTRFGVLAAVLDSDVGLALRLIRELMDQGLVFEAVLTDVLMPIQADVGLRWSRGEYRIAEEHAVTACMEAVVSTLGGAIAPDEDAPYVVVACAEGDSHSLPARVVAVFLELRGWRVQFLGSGIPAGDLGGYLSEASPAALVLSCAMRAHLIGARASIAASHAAGVPVVVGGKAFGTDDTIALQIGADAWTNEFDELDAILRTWRPSIEEAEAIAAALRPELQMLTEHHRSIVEAVRSQLSEAIPYDDLDLILDNLVASVLVGNADPLIAHARWRDSVSSTRLPTADVLETFARAIDADATESHRFLAAALAN